MGNTHLHADGEMGIAAIGDDDFAQHLSDHDFEVFVGDFDPLGLIDLLDFFHDVELNGFDTADFEEFFRIDMVIGQVFTGLDVFALLEILSDMLCQ